MTPSCALGFQVSPPSHTKHALQLVLITEVVNCGGKESATTKDPGAYHEDHHSPSPGLGPHPEAHTGCPPVPRLPLYIHYPISSSPCFQEMFHPHFPDKETESLQVTCSVSHSSGLHIVKSFELVLYHCMLSVPECTSDYPFFDSTAEHISACPPL